MERPDIYKRRYFKPGSCPSNCKKCLFKSAREIIRKVYGFHLTFCKCHDAPSLVVRNEEELENRDTPRFAKGIHIFDDMGSHHDYIGFMGIRIAIRKEDFDLSPIAEAFLAPPRRMKNPPYHITCLSSYSSYLGVLPFECTPFTMHDRRLGGYCAQGSLFIALLMMTPYGARVLGPATITEIIAPKPLPEELEFGELNLTNDQFIIKGLSTPDMLKFLKSELSHISAVHETFILDDNQDKCQEDFKRSVIFYLNQRFPVILTVKWNILYFHPDDQLSDNPGHAIVIIGYKKMEKDVCFVYHDGNGKKGPYQEAKGSHLFKAAVGEKPKFGFMVPVPKEVKLPIRACDEWANDESQLAELKIRKTFLANSRCLDGFLLSSHVDTDKRRQFQSCINSLKLPKFVWCQLFFETDQDLDLGTPFMCWLYDATYDAENDDLFRYPVVSCLIYKNTSLEFYEIGYKLEADKTYQIRRGVIDELEKGEFKI